MNWKKIGAVAFAMLTVMVIVNDIKFATKLLKDAFTKTTNDV